MKTTKPKPPVYRDPTVAELAPIAAQFASHNEPEEAARLALQLWIACFEALRDFAETKEPFA